MFLTCKQRDIQTLIYSSSQGLAVYWVCLAQLEYPLFRVGPLWSWSHHRWIYNYLCNQWLSTLKVVSSNPAHVELYAIQHYMIKFVSDLQQVGGFLYTTLYDKVCQWFATSRLFSPVSSTNKTDCHDVAEILLQVTLNTTNINQAPYSQGLYPAAEKPGHIT